MILIAIEDVTEQNLQKQQLLVKHRELTEAIAVSESANQAKSKFLGHISHELRTPLNSIMGFSQILQDNSNLDAESKEFLNIICESGQHLNSLISDLLDISRIDAEKMAIEPNILSLANFLKITVNMVYLKAIEKNLTLTTQFADDLPENIYADEKRLRQVLLNLLGNAIKFTSVGEITFSVSKIYSEYLNKWLIKFAIADTGVGISSDGFEKIFMPFEQVGTSISKFQGTGLGLAISQYLVQKMGGAIVVDSEVGMGSTFSFALDLIEEQSQNSSKMIAAAPLN
jgi:two-component system CheB/CheR fusion protein